MLHDERDDRRQSRRAQLRLRIARLEGLDPPPQTRQLWTTDVSAGGMFFQANLADQPPLGARLSFELSIPPGEGYSSSAGKVRGTGEVVRVLASAAPRTGVAVQFTRPLALHF